MSPFITSKLQGNVNRVSRLYTVLTILLALLAAGGCLYFLDFQGAKSNSVENYGSLDIEIALFMVLFALIIAVPFIVLFDHDMEVDPLVPYVIATVLNVHFAVAVIYYTMRIPNAPMDTWMVSWLLGIAFLFILSPVATSIKYVIEKCFARRMKPDIVLKTMKQSKHNRVYEFNFITT